MANGDLQREFGYILRFKHEERYYGGFRDDRLLMVEEGCAIHYEDLIVANKKVEELAAAGIHTILCARRNIILSEADRYFGDRLAQYMADDLVRTDDYVSGTKSREGC